MQMTTQRSDNFLFWSPEEIKGMRVLDVIQSQQNKQIKLQG